MHGFLKSVFLFIFLSWGVLIFCTSNIKMLKTCKIYASRFTFSFLKFKGQVRRERHQATTNQIHVFPKTAKLFV